MKTPDVATEHPQQHPGERPVDQAWFWTPQWQAKEADVDAAREDAEGPRGCEGPLLLCQRYAAGDLSRSDLVEALVIYPYPTVERDPYDDFSPFPPGAWTEVEDAAHRGLIDDGLYAEVFHRRYPPEANKDAEDFTSAEADPLGPRAGADLLADLQRWVAEGVVAVALAEGRDPAEALKTSAAEELLVERAAEAAAEEEADAAFSPAMSPQEFLDHLAELHRRATEAVPEADQDRKTR